MALLGTIRNRFGWLMMGLVFFGVGAFLFMDISPGANAPGGKSQTVGTINGEKVSNETVQQYSQEYQGGQYLQEEIHKEVWNRIVGEKLLTQKTMEAGMTVTPDEMGDLFLSSDPRRLSQIVVSRLADPKTRQVNTEQVKQAIDMFHNTNALLQQAGDNAKQKEELLDQQRNWLALEKSVELRALQEKYFAAVEMGIYTPTWMVEMERNTQEATYNFDYVRIPYTNINDKVEVSDKEMNDYIKAHPRQYKREATANVDFILFDVNPTAKDSATYYGEMAAYAEEFNKSTSIKDDSNFIARHYGNFPLEYATKDQMLGAQPQQIIDSLFDAEDGTVFGPFIHERKYRILKKVETKSLPDSVKSRHILRKATNPQDGQKAQILLDSLLKELKTNPDANFDTLAAKFSEDGSRFTGGDLGWKAKDGSFVPQFEEYMFYTGKKDSFSLVYTQFGIHIIQITGYKYETDKVGVRIATVDKDIIPSAETTEKKQREVIEFITNNRKAEGMKTAAKAAGFNISTAAGLEEGGFDILGVGKNSTAADIIRWAHNPETNVGDVTNRPYAIENDQLNCTEKFVVTSLTARAPKGLATIDDPKVKGDVDRILRNEKKTEIVKKKLSSLTSLDAIAGEYSLIKETATAVQYGTAKIGTIGTEPKVAALAAATKVGEMSGAVGGKEGVYVLQLTSKNDAPEMTNVKSARDKVNSRIKQVVSGGIYDGMKETADIEDNRSTY